MGGRPKGSIAPVRKMLTKAQRDAKTRALRAKRISESSSRFHEKLHVPWARDLSWMGKNKEEIAAHFGISPQSLSVWFKKSPALLAASTEYDRKTPEIVRKLYERATGHEVKEEYYAPDDMGELVLKARKIKEIPGDTTAQLAILQNRLPDQWKAKSDLNISANVTFRRAILELSDD